MEGILKGASVDFLNELWGEIDRIEIDFKDGEDERCFRLIWLK